MWEMNIERGLLVIPVLNFLPMLWIFGKKKKEEEIQYVIRAQNKVLGDTTRLKGRVREGVLTLYRPIDKGKHRNGVWGHV